MEPGGLALAIALASAALMGAAIQRGGTCMVAAVDEAVSERRFGRAGALIEAAVWVGGLVAVAQVVGMAPTATRYAAGTSSLLGGVVLGLGAWINRACVFGAVARIGSGQLAWLGTPLGFFLGSLAPIQGSDSGIGSEAFDWPWVAALAFTALVLWRASQAFRAPAPGQHLWHPHRATLLIAITFFTTLMTVGFWAYTDALAALAHSMSSMEARIALRGMMVLALFGGAVAGGWLTGKLSWQQVTVPALLRCVAGGCLLGLGASLVPGSNDGLIMFGLPLLLPYAWMAVASMTATIAMAIVISGALSRRLPGRAPAVDRPAGR